MEIGYWLQDLREYLRVSRRRKALRQPGGGGTDAGAIHKQRAGIPSVSVSIPGRYLHTPVSMIRLDDWKHTLALIYAALENLHTDIFSAER